MCFRGTENIHVQFVKYLEVSFNCFHSACRFYQRRIFAPRPVVSILRSYVCRWHFLWHFLSSKLFLLANPCFKRTPFWFFLDYTPWNFCFCKLSLLLSQRTVRCWWRIWSARTGLYIPWKSQTSLGTVILERLKHRNFFYPWNFKRAWAAISFNREF